MVLSSNRDANDIVVSTEGDILVRRASAGVYLAKATDKATVAATATVTTPAATSQPQVTEVQFHAHTPAAGYVYSVTVDDTTYSVTVGDPATDPTTVDDDWTSVLNGLKAKIEADAGRTVDVVIDADDRQLTLTARSNDTQQEITGETTLPSVSSSGDIQLTSSAGRITESYPDAAVDLVADRLVLSAATGIDGLEIAANALDALTAAGDIVLTERDGYHEKSLGLDIVRAQTTKLEGGSSQVSITTVNELRVGDNAHPAAAGAVRANTIRLTSTDASVSVATPASGDSLDYDSGIAFVADDVVSLYRFFTAPKLMEYRAGGYFLFANSSRLFPSDMASETLIIESGGTLSLSGDLQASKDLELIAGEDLILTGTVSALEDDADGKIDNLVLTAKGLRPVLKAIDFNKDNDTKDTVSEATAKIDYNGDGDMLDTIAEAAVSTPSGFLNVQVNQLPAAEFQLRAALDIFVELDSDLALTGFVGGVTGYESARSVTLDIHGTLRVTSGIVAADQVAGAAAAAAAAAADGNVLPDDLIAANTSIGRVSITADSITSDGASVFIAYRLVVDATNTVQLNTLVDHISVDSTDSARHPGQRADGLGVDTVVAKNGTISIKAGGETFVRDVRNIADGKNITVQRPATCGSTPSRRAPRSARRRPAAPSPSTRAVSSASGKGWCATATARSRASRWTRARRSCTAGRSACWARRRSRRPRRCLPNRCSWPTRRSPAPAPSSRCATRRRPAPGWSTTPRRRSPRRRCRRRAAS